MARIHRKSLWATTALLALGLAVGGAAPASAAPPAAPAPPAPAAASQTAGAAAPLAFPPTGYHAFTPQAPNWAFSDGNGSGQEQIRYATSSTEQWGFTMSAARRAGIVGNVVENANLYCGSTLVTNYGQHIEPPNYQFHGSRGGININCLYHTIIKITYQTSSGGSGVLTAQWNWYLTLV